MVERAKAGTFKEFFEELGDNSYLYTQIDDFIEGKTVLDVACGTGMGTSLISEKANHVTGVDISESVVNSNNNNFRSDKCKFICVNMLKLPFDDSSFDTVISFETIEHTLEYEKFLEEIKRILKKGGYLVLSTPNNGFDKKIKTKFSKYDFHVIEFSRKELEGLLNKDFKIVHYYGKNRKNHKFDEIGKAKSIPEWRSFIKFRFIPYVSEILPMFLKKIYRKRFHTSSNIDEFYVSKDDDGIRDSISFFVVAKKL